MAAHKKGGKSSPQRSLACLKPEIVFLRVSKPGKTTYLFIIYITILLDHFAGPVPPLCRSSWERQFAFAEVPCLKPGTVDWLVKALRDVPCLRCRNTPAQQDTQLDLFELASSHVLSWAVVVMILHLISPFF